MKKAILYKFMQVLLGALLLNSIIFYIVISSVMLQSTKKDMFYMLESIDHVLNYEEDINTQIERLAGVAGQNESRLTMIRLDGSIQADTGLEETVSMDNHLERVEVSDALRYGKGDSRRFSDTLEKNMLYVAYRSQFSDMILRLASPYSGLVDYAMMLLPATWLSFAIALFISTGVAERFSASITKPLHEISREMLAVQGNYTKLQLETYQYPELNIIAETTTKLSEHVTNYLSQLEMEKQIRQEFFSNASHELKTPITSIQGYAELLESDMVENEAVKKDFIKRIKHEAMNMANLINDILMISRLETKEAQVTKAEVWISLVLDEVVAALKPLAASQKVLIHSNCQPLRFYSNAQQMRELISNLVGNAVQYSQPGGQVWVTITKEGQDMVLSVKDNGLGIPEEDQKRIFERFYRVDKGRSKKQGGTGLGLAIVKHIIQFYKGSITLTSKLNEGSEFIIRIPIEMV